MKYEITKEQLNNIVLTEDVRIVAQVKEWFPEAFKPVLEVGKWHKTKFVLINITNIDEKGKVYGYGWDLCSGIWYGSDNDDWGVDNAIEATESEVFEALKNEAVRRGYKNGNHYCLNSCITEKKVKDNYFFDYGNLWYGTNISANCVFKKGKWAEIIPTISKEEAEKLLNKKII